MLTLLAFDPEEGQLPLYQTHREYVCPGVTAGRQDASEARCDSTSLRSPAVQLVTVTLSATDPEWASLVWLQVAALLATLEPACWKHAGSVDPPGLEVSREGLFTRLPVVGSGGAGGGIIPPVASGRITLVEQRF